MHPANIKSRRGFVLLFSLVLLLTEFTFLPAAVGFALPQQSRETDNSAKAKTAQIQISGMTCAPCARGLEASFRRMAGVQKADVDYKTGQAVIVFDPAKQSAASLSAHVVASGFQVKEIKVV